MKKSDYHPLICGCDLEFGIHKKDYDKSHAYNCPMCLSANVVTPEDLKPARPFRQRRVQPYIPGKED